jgi:hypothetical protein
MSMVTPTLNLPPPALASTAAKPALSTSASSTSSTPATASTPPAPGAPSAAPAVPSTTVTLSPQAQSAFAAASHPAPSSAAATAPAAATVAHDSSVYESLKNGISTAVGDVGDVIAGGAEAVVDGVETTLSTANKIVQGALGLPFAAAAKVCDAAGAIISEL